MRLHPTARPSAPLTLRGRFTAPLANGAIAFFKVSEASKQSRLSFRQEALCLRRLQGLAVPKVFSLRKAEVQAMLGGVPIDFIAQEYLEGTPFIGKHLPPPFVLGMWWFFVEQLVAIRRVGLVYTDIKVTNLVVRTDPSRLTIIDFGNAQPVERNGRYSNYSLHYTPGYEAPEQTRARYLTEASFTYQLAMALVYALSGLNNLHLRNGETGRDIIKKKLAQCGTKTLETLVFDSLKDDPKARPANYEVVLKRLLTMKSRSELPERAVQTWLELRAPYASILADVDL